MSLFDARKRDGNARIGNLKLSDEESISTPAVIDAESVFPSLEERGFTNLPPSASKAEFGKYFVAGEEPTAVHPQSESVEGSVLLFSNWNTVISDARRHAEYMEKLLAVCPPDAARYAPACGLPSNVASLIYLGFDLFDYTAVDLAAVQKKFCTPEGEFDASYMEKGICDCPGCKAGDLKLHNRLALEKEIALARVWIEQGQLREFMEMRCRLHAEQVSLLRHVDRRPGFAVNLPVVRSSRFLANSSESMTRAEIAFFEDRVINRFVPGRTDVCVLLPCAARKPYSLSRSHQLFSRVVDSRAHEVIVTSPLGVVPRELELIYPAGHYDVPVTGYWDKEESAILVEYLTAYLTKHRYDRVICHLEGGAKEVAKTAAQAAGVELEFTCNDDKPLSPDSLRALNNALRESRKRRTDPIRGTLLWQFGELVDTKGWLTKGRYPNQKIYEKKTQIFSIDPETGLLRPTHEGWKYINGYRVWISDGFVPQGDILAPGIADCDPQIREGDEVFVGGEGYQATGKTTMGADEMLRANRGIAVRVRKTNRK
ncbi:PUA domain containing protein [Methanocorpusculum labreanum Z]|uniref:PUA domain containing protein n=1 Tax=Methanocorpusculum labreanum (strain ATCC 43576 / DSM 4855 / Z) TaxID=410358 RepID=A2SSS1_METLZ|nr:archaeosine synthase subunit alpha [Methanocorpusculum labreanum]ABN07377.1 PUA domain containing protein [Methanocorpusculum labreanum Z]